MNDLKPITVDGFKYVLFSKQAGRVIDLETFSHQPLMFVHIAERLVLGEHDKNNYRHSWELIPFAPWMRASIKDIGLTTKDVTAALRTMLEVQTKPEIEQPMTREFWIRPVGESTKLLCGSEKDQVLKNIWAWIGEMRDPTEDTYEIGIQNMTLQRSLTQEMISMDGKQAGKLTKDFEKAVRLKLTDADNCNRQAREENEERARKDLEPLSTNWGVFVWQNPTNPRGYTVILQAGQPKHEWAVSVETARERLTRALEGETVR
jgi:hypothetical protein